MIGISLTDSGVELLGQRRGLDAYVDNGKTMGIPLLYPWANRLGSNTYEAEGTTVTLTAGEYGVRTDPNGLPIHGVLAAFPHWRVTHESGHEITAEVDFSDDDDLLASFPFPHRLALTITLYERTLRLRISVTPTGDRAGATVFRLPSVSATAGRAARSVADRDAGDAAPDARREGTAHR